MAKTVYTKKYYNITGMEKEPMVVSKYTEQGCMSIYADGTIACNSLTPESYTDEKKATAKEFNAMLDKAVNQINKKFNLKIKTK